ncbi:MAG: site-specific integrase [Pseudomonadota bacterium]
MKINTVKSIVGKNGKLVVRFFDNAGKIKQKTLNLADTKANRKSVSQTIPAFEKTLRDKAEQGAKLPIHFGYYADKYLEQLTATGHTKTIAHTGRIKKMLEHFGSQTDINNITELAIEDFFQGLRCKRETKLDWLVVMRGVFDKARKGRAIEKNIAESYKLPLEASINDESAVEPFALDEVKRLLLHSKGMVLHNYLGIAFHLGTRPEETIALKIEDVDLTSGTVQIERAITKGVIKSPKTKASKRSIPLPDHARVFFSELIKKAKEKSSLYLFSDANGIHLNDIEDLRGKKYRDGAWYQLLKKAEVTPRKLMQTRHTFAVMAIRSQEYTMQEVASILGHSSLAMIISHYGKHLGASHMKVARSVNIFKDQGDVLGDAEIKVEIREVA